MKNVFFLWKNYVDRILGKVLSLERKVNLGCWKENMGFSYFFDDGVLILLDGIFFR